LESNVADKLEIAFSTNFSKEEVTEVTETFSEILPVDQRLYIRMSAEVLPAVLIFALGFVAGSIADGFFKAMGSDLYKKAKEKTINAIKNKEKPTVIFEMKYKETEISIRATTNDERTLEKVFDTINEAKEIAVSEIDKEETPKMTKLEMVFDGDWQLNGGTNWQPVGKPRTVKFYEFNKKTGKWELTRDWS
jgi:hypothetical protein